MKKGSVSGRILFSLSIRWVAVLTVLAIAVVLSACTDSPRSHAGRRDRRRWRQRHGSHTGTIAHSHPIPDCHPRAYLNA